MVGVITISYGPPFQIIVIRFYPSLCVRAGTSMFVCGSVISVIVVANEVYVFLLSYI